MSSGNTRDREVLPARAAAQTGLRRDAHSNVFTLGVNGTFSAASQPRGNALLAALPEVEYRTLHPHLEPVRLQLGQAISEPGERVTHAFFPTTGIVSLASALKDGSSAEIAVTGNEGMIGISLLLGGVAPPYRALVQIDAHAYRLRAELLRQEFERSVELRRLLLRYTQALMTQISQTAACNRHHTVTEQLCRSLLMRLDRMAGNELQITQQLIASALGVRRETVTEAAGHLRQAGSIDYAGGRITVLDRSGLERQACECYTAVRNEYQRLLPNPGPALSDELG